MQVIATMLRPAQNQILIAHAPQLLTGPIDDFLEHQGFLVRHVASGAEVARAVRQSAPDLLVLGSMLSDGDGFQLLRKLRHEHSSVEMHIVILIDGALLGSDKPWFDAGASALNAQPEEAHIQVLAAVRALLPITAVATLPK